LRLAGDFAGWDRIERKTITLLPIGTREIANKYKSASGTWHLIIDQGNEAIGKFLLE
jgi:hypothetical protein